MVIVAVASGTVGLSLPLMLTSPGITSVNERVHVTSVARTLQFLQLPDEIYRGIVVREHGLVSEETLWKNLGSEVSYLGSVAVHRVDVVSPFNVHGGDGVCEAVTGARGGA